MSGKGKDLSGRNITKLDTAALLYTENAAQEDRRSIPKDKSFSPAPPLTSCDPGQVTSSLSSFDSSSVKWG